MSVLLEGRQLSRGLEAWRAAGFTPAALKEELARLHREFEQALKARDYALAAERWAENGILWSQGRLPVFGRGRIREFLAQKPLLAGEGRHRSLKLTTSGTTLYETGERGQSEVRIKYLCVWRPGAEGRFLVTREVWDYVVARDVN